MDSSLHTYTSAVDYTLFIDWCVAAATVSAVKVSAARSVGIHNPISVSKLFCHYHLGPGTNMPGRIKKYFSVTFNYFHALRSKDGQ